MKKTLLIIPLLILFITACETQGDKFPRFAAKEKLMGKIMNHEIPVIFFLNEQTGFVVISKDTLLKTTDGCKTFTRVLSDSTSVFQGIRFVNENVGFVIGRNNFIFKTKDGGNNWEKIKIDISGAVLKDIKCLNQDTLFVATGGDSQQNEGFVVRSTDGGNTWDITRTQKLAHLFFVNELTGFACGSDGIIKTTDCGKKWDTISEQSASSIMFFDEKNGYCSDKRSLFKTTDGGINWKLVRTIKNPSWIVGKDFSRIECLNSLNDNDLIFTLNARIIKVTEGQKWFQYEFTRPYYQLQMIGRNKGIVYGFENLIMVDF